MTKRFLVGLLLISSLLLSLTGCSSAGDRLKGLGANLADIKVSDTGASITIQYVNETLVPIALSGSDHKLSVNGTSLGEIRSTTPVGVQKLSAVTQSIAVTDTRIVARLRELPTDTPLRYRLESTLRILAGDEKLTAPSKTEGSVQVTRATP